MSKLRLYHYKRIIFLLLGVQLLSTIVIFLLKQYLPPIVPLLYGKPSGVTQLAPADALFILPLAGVVSIVLGIIISEWVRDRFIDAILLGVVVTVTVLSTITLYNIVSIVGSIPLFS